MKKLNEIFGGELSMAIKIFNNQYPKKFLNQLISSQLDVDRLDFLKRDSYYTGVVEGVISTDRIITMLNVHNGELVAEAKGIYSLEKFIVARRLMYWQVYYHKTVVAAELLLVQILRRARFLSQGGHQLFGTPTFKKFIENQLELSDFNNKPELLNDFSDLDDFDIFTSIKVWMKHNDHILSTLCKQLVNRQLNRIVTSNTPFTEEYIKKIKNKCMTHCNLDENDADYFVYSDTIENYAYNPQHDKINIQYRDGRIIDITEASHQLNVAVLSGSVSKYFICYPKFLDKI
jgi:HD superfamily phosphohydrolase